MGMKRRVTAGGKASKVRRRKTRGGAAPAIARHSRSSVADLRKHLDQSRRKLKEALEQQAATSEVLRVISSSPGELAPVFEAMLANATRICEARFGNLLLYDGNVFRVASVRGPPAWEELRRRDPVVPFNPKIPLYRVAATRQVQHVTDLRMEETYLERDPASVAMVEVSGARTILVVPMLKENELVGAIGIFRTEVRPFSDKQIELMTNFANQAVIAIENARLLNELRQRTDDLTESLEQHTATSEVLRIISSSPGDLEPVFKAMLANATRLCEAKFGNLLLREGDGFRGAATYGVPQEYGEWHQREPVISLQDHPHIPLARAARMKEVLHISDLTVDRSYTERDPRVVALVEGAGAQSLVVVPMLKDQDVVGAFAIFRQELRPFTQKQIELVQNFAAQAVIAIENTRLLNELRESLQQQTATADVLKVISRSTFDLQVVLDTLIQSAVRLCDADKGTITRSMACSTAPNPTATPPKSGNAGETRVSRQSAAVSPDAPCSKVVLFTSPMQMPTRTSLSTRPGRGFAPCSEFPCYGRASRSACLPWPAPTCARLPTSRLTSSPPLPTRRQ
jgi:GAF domain-containing protein